MAEPLRRRADTADTEQPPPDGAEKEAIIDVVLDLLARAVVADTIGDQADYGYVPPGTEP